MAEIQPVGPANLLIDEQNPRIAVPNEGQHKALQSLAEHLGSKLSALAKHIVTYGINPSDLPIVMPVPNRTGRYTVLEGNRRIAALKAMETPEAISGVVPARVLLGMSLALLKLSGDSVHDYATISDDSPSPSCASRARSAATS